MTRPEIGLQFLIMARMVYGVFGMNWKLSRGFKPTDRKVQTCSKQVVESY